MLEPGPGLRAEVRSGPGAWWCPQEPRAAVVVTSKGKNSWGTPEHAGHVRTLVCADNDVFLHRNCQCQCTVMWVCKAVVPSGPVPCHELGSTPDQSCQPSGGPRAALEPQVTQAAAGAGSPRSVNSSGDTSRDQPPFPAGAVWFTWDTASL